MGRRFIDLIGKKFNRLTVVKEVGRNNRCVIWLCRCDCGQYVKASTSSIKSSNTKSCGCLNIEKIILRNKNRSKHGYGGTKIYHTWRGIIRRCHDQKSQYYYLYGQRGINVCKRWLKFENFLEDMGKPPTGKHQIDRIDNNGGYSKKNCRWATPLQQGRNKRNNHLIIFNGKTQCLTAWAEEYGIKRKTLEKRLCVLKWDLETALTKGVRKINNDSK